MLIKSTTKVEKLTQRVERIYEEKERYEDIEKRQTEREKTIREAPQWCYTDFYCPTCQEDLLKCAAYKVIQSDWTSPQRIAFYEAFRACHKGLRRWITDKSFDPYFRQSRMLEQQRREATANGDLLQPDDYGFKSKYGDINKKKWQQMELEEKAKWESKKEGIFNIH